jgi:Fe-S oxidoreductase
LNARTRKPDFSHDVYRAMEVCLSCKACATQCPIKVDVPSFKSEFLAAYHTRYPRRFRDYLVGALESAAYLGARLPNGLAAISKTGVVTSLLSRLGLIQTPTPISGLRRGLRLRGVEMAHPERLIHLSAAEREQHVIIVQDAFTSFFEPAVLLAAVDVLQRLGFQPLIAHFRPNGKGMHVKGFLNWFRRTARKNAEALRRLEASGIPLVGIEPAVTLTYRDEYSVEELGVRVHLLQEWLVKVLPGRILSGERKETYTLLGHCTERTACPDSQADWRRILAHFGLEGMSAAVGCCGMCGVFGHETEHAAESQGIYDMSWRPIVEQSRTDEGLLLATGYSCRTQVERFSGLRPAHPIQFIEEVTRPSTNAAGPSTSAQL